MRVLVTGSRSWPWPCAVEYELDQIYEGLGDSLTLVHGDCPTGVDSVANLWGWSKRFALVEKHPADWAALGKPAGLIRNQQMVDLGADLCLAFIHNQSKGATHCAERAINAGIETRLFELGVT